MRDDENRGRAGDSKSTPAKQSVSEQASESRKDTIELKPKRSPERAAAEMMVDGLGTNAATAAIYSKMIGRLDLTECIAALVAEIRRVRSGDLGGVEATLVAQAMTLNAIFTQLACQASRTTVVDQIDRFTRLAFKAQSQCRAALETLASIKNPPMVFARQANIAQGPQQVNNSVMLARSGNPESERDKLLGAHGQQLDGRAEGEASPGNSSVEAVAEINGAENTRRQGASLAERGPRKRAPTDARTYRGSQRSHS